MLLRRFECFWTPFCHSRNLINSLREKGIIQIFRLRRAVCQLATLCDYNHCHAFWLVWYMCVMRQPPTTYDRVPNFTRIESINFDFFNMRSVSGCVASYAVSSSQLTHRFLLERPVKNSQGRMVTTPKDLAVNLSFISHLAFFLKL